jgi:hypothetical protein
MKDDQNDGRALVAEVRDAAARHKMSWAQLVPSPYVVDLGAEPSEELAFQEMAGAKRRLRDHICTIYGITAAELCSLAHV